MQAEVSRCFVEKVLNTGLRLRAPLTLDCSVLSREMGQISKWERGRRWGGWVSGSLWTKAVCAGA